MITTRCGVSVAIDAPCFLSLGSHACGASVLVETFTAGSPELALVDVVLLDVTGVGLILLIARRKEVVDGVEPDDVQRLQRALRCAGGDAPGLVDRLGVRDSVHNEARGRLEKRDQE